MVRIVKLGAVAVVGLGVAGYLGYKNRARIAEASNKLCTKVSSMANDVVSFAKGLVVKPVMPVETLVPQVLTPKDA